MRRDAGFTLLELLLATVLCSMVMVGVLGLITRIVAETAASPESSEESLPADFAADAWVSLLADDLRHAVKISADEPGQLVVVGYHALQGESRLSVHAPVRVEYLTQELGGKSWLVRRQVALNAASNDHVQRDLVCAGVTRWALTQQQASKATGNSSKPPVDEKPSGASRAGPGPGADDPNQNVIINGSNYFRRYVPAWYLQSGQGRQTSAGSVGQAVQPAEPDPPRPRSALVSKGALWRLQAWRGDEVKPLVDCLVVIR